MLVNYSIENFKSFYEKAELSLKSSKAKGDNESVIKTKYGNMLKVIYLYGANSSGKSNFIESFHFLQFFATTPNISDESIEKILKYRRFVYNSHAVEKPISIQVEFVVNDILYNYSISISGDGIQGEKLFFKKGIRSDYKDIYSIDIKSGKYEVNKDLFDRNLQVIFTAIKPNNKCSFLSTLSNMDYLGNEHIKNVYKWIVNIVCLGNRQGEIRVNMLYQDISEEELSTVLNKHQRFLNYCDIRIEKLKANKNDVTDKRFVYTENKNELGEMISMPFDYESEGTKKILTLYSLLFEKLDEASLFVVDEMDSKLNPILFEKLIESFKKNNINKRNIQLVQSSHSFSTLVNKEKYRLEEIVLVDKDKNGSHLSTLKDKEILTNHSVFKNFYMGNYGGIPNIDINKF